MDKSGTHRVGVVWLIKKEMAKQLTITGIKSWPKDDRPREKLLKQGEHKLSDTELLAIALS